MSAIHRSELPATTRPASARATGLGLISRRAAIATLASSALLMLAGCSSSDGADAATASVQPRNMVVALGTGARANTPALTSLPAQLTDAIAATVETGGAFDLIVIDGDPRPLGAATLASTAKTDSRRAEENAEAAQAAAQLLLTQKAVEPEADVYAALSRAADDLRSLPTFEGGVNDLYLVDSCLGTTGELDYTGARGLTLASNPADVAAFVQQNDPLDLTGITVHALFVGETASPQQALAASDSQRLADTLAAVVEQAGGTFELSSAQLPAATTVSAGASALPEVSTCPVSSDAVFTGGLAGTGSNQLVLDGATGVSFTPDTASFANVAQATQAIDQAGDAIRNSGVAVIVQGSCASVDTEASRAQLAQARAQTVADALVAAGVPASQIEQVTYVPNGFVPDRAADGSLIADAAQQNRAVRIVPA